MDTPPSSCLQSPPGQVICFSSRNTGTWSGYLILAAVCVLCIAWVPLRGVAAGTYEQDIVPPSIPGRLGGVGPGVAVLGSRFGVIQRRDVSNKQLLLSASGATTTTTASPGNNSSTAGIDDTQASLQPAGSSRDGGAHSAFLSKVTPSHWAPADDPWPTDPTRPPTTTTPANASTVMQIITRSTIPAIIYTSTTTAHFSSAHHEVHRTSPPPISIYDQKSRKEFQPSQKDYYLSSTSLTESDWSSGATGYNYTHTVSQGGKYLTTKDDFDGSNDSGSSDRREPSVVSKPRWYLGFKCWSSSHTHSGNRLEPVWVSEIGRRIVFPALLLVSWAFTSVALILHILVPDLRANMGQILMCYILAIWLKCMITPISLFLMLCAPDFTNKKIACTVLAFVSYMMSLAYRFWLNIMCFDIWRKVSHLARLEHVRPVKLLFYHLYGWGMPAMFGLMALLIREFGPDSIIKPGFDDSQCWFDHSEGAIHEPPWRSAAHSQYDLCYADKALLLTDATNQHS